jgi:hypothetical protein
MAYREPLQAVETGVVLDPRDIMVNFNELAREVNGHIDRDNLVTGAVTSAKIATQEIVYLFDNPVEGSPVYTVAAGATGQWEDITDMSKTVTLPGGDLIVDTDVNFTWSEGTYSEKCQFRTLVNGVQIAETGWFQIRREQTVANMTGSAVITAGSNTVSVQVRAWRDPYYHMSDVNNGLNKAATSTYNIAYTLNTITITAGNIVGLVRAR